MEHHFFAYISRMRYIQRWGLMRNTYSENDLEHSMQAAFFAHAIAVIGVKRYHRAYSPERIMAMAAYHDATEVITGDMPTPVKYHHSEMKDQFSRMEELAEGRLLSMLPNDLRPSFEPLICHDESLQEWQIVKAADKICAYVKCLEEKKVGNSEFEMARRSIKKTLDRMDLPEVQDFITEFVPGFSLSLDEISEMDDK